MSNVHVLRAPALTPSPINSVFFSLSIRFASQNSRRRPSRCLVFLQLYELATQFIDAEVADDAET